MTSSPILPNYPVGATFRAFSDSSRTSWTSNEPRPLTAMVWYPADQKAQVSEQTAAIFKMGEYAPDAELSDGLARYPLIVVSHGTGGAAVSIAWLCVRLAAAGYIVASINHHGNTGAEPKMLLEGFLLWWERPADVSVLIDCMLADPQFGPRIDPQRIGVAGFSIGGYTALASVGARLEMERWQPYCTANPSDPICQLPPEANYSLEQVGQYLEADPHVLESWPRSNNDYRDARIGAAFAIAPMAGAMISAASLHAIKVPVKFVVGSADDQAIPALNAIPFSKQIPQSELEVLPNVTHYTFLSEGTAEAKPLVPALLADPEGVDRAAVHTHVAQEAAVFFARAFQQNELAEA